MENLDTEDIKEEGKGSAILGEDVEEGIDLAILEEDILKYKYIVTLFHHNENLAYFNEYHLAQINFMKKKIKKEKLPIKIQVYIFTSVNVESLESLESLKSLESLESLERGEIKEIELDCSYISKYFYNKLNDFKIKIKQNKIKQNKIGKIRYINILPYEYDLMKRLFNFSEENDRQFTNLMFGEVKLMDNIDWNNNTIGAKRFVSQSLVINKHKRNYPHNCLGYFHWQIDLYIKIGIPSYAKDCYEENNPFYELIKQKNNQVLDISNFLYNPPDFRIQNIDDGLTNNVFNDIGEIIVSTNNSEYYTFMIAHYDVKNKVDHFTLGQIDIDGIIGYKLMDEKIACIKGITDKDRSPYKPKYKECKLLVHSHYDKFYITNIKTIIETDAYYNPLFTNWSEDIFFTKCLNKRNLIILPFFLFTYTVKQKDTIYDLPSYLFSNSTFKAFAGTFSQSEESKDELKINYKSHLESCPSRNPSVNIILAMDKSCTLAYKTPPKVYADARSNFSMLLGTLNYYYNPTKQCQSIDSTIRVLYKQNNKKLEDLNNYLINEENGNILIPSDKDIPNITCRITAEVRKKNPELSCYTNPLNIPDIMDGAISNENFNNLLYNNFFRIVKRFYKDKYIFNIIFSSDFLNEAPNLNDKFTLYKKYYSWDYDFPILNCNRNFEPSTVSGIIETYMKCVYKYLQKCVTLTSVDLNCEQECLACPIVKANRKAKKRTKEEEEIKQNNKKCADAYKMDNDFEEHEYRLNRLNIVKLPLPPVEVPADFAYDEAAAEDEVDKRKKLRSAELKYLKYKMKYLNLKKISMSNKTIY